MKNEFGGSGEIKPCVVKCGADIFENAIREMGVDNACEWFGYEKDSEFTRDTIKVLRERSEQK